MPLESAHADTRWVPHRTSDVIRAISIALIVFAMYFVSYNRTLPPTADEMIDFGLTQSLAKWQIFSIDQVSTVGPNPEEFGLGGHRYSKYGPLQSVLSVPLFWLAQRLPIGAVDTVLLLNQIVTAVSMALLFLLVRRLGYASPVALAIVGIVAFGTPLWVHSKRYFSEPTITLCIIATCYCAYSAATSRRRRWLVATGLAFGLAAAAKYINVVLLLPIPLYLAWSALQPMTKLKPGEIYRRLAPAAGWFALGAIPIGGLLMLYDIARFGSPLTTGYARWEGFSTPVWVGVAGFLFSPGKSIFVYTPFFLLLPFWARRFIRRMPTFSACLGAIIVLHLLLYGSWWVWWGAWAWGPRFIVPILPLVAVFLAEGISSVRSWVVRGIAVGLALLSLAIQILGISVDHTVYLVSLLPLNPRPDTLTLWNVAYSPILHQIPLMTRQWLDFAWIERTGPSMINAPALLGALASVGVALVCFGIIWRSASWTWWIPTLVVTAAFIAGSTYRDLHIYGQDENPSIAAIVRALATAPANTGIIQLIPHSEIAYDNWQKRPLPEIGWIEEPKPHPIIVRRIQRFEALYPQIWVVTETPAKVPENGIEAMLDRSLAQIGDEQIGPFRLLRYVTHPADLRVIPQPAQFSEGIKLEGFSVRGRVAPGRTIDLTLKWQAGPEAIKRPDYTVFVHLVSDQGKLVAQHDNPPASGYATTSSWTPNEVIYDDHSLVIPADAPPDVHLVQVGLYLPSNGKRLPRINESGKEVGRMVTIDLRRANGQSPVLAR